MADRDNKLAFPRSAQPGLGTDVRAARRSGLEDTRKMTTLYFGYAPRDRDRTQPTRSNPEDSLDRTQLNPRMESPEYDEAYSSTAPTVEVLRPTF
jgi:hypothetical protein